MQTSCKGFTIRDMTEDFTREAFTANKINLEELSDKSTLFTKKVKEMHDRDMCLLQVMFEDHAIVYNLQSENRYEVALLYDILSFTDPTKFSMTGFELKSQAK